jgi:hypothetical protein
MQILIVRKMNPKELGHFSQKLINNKLKENKYNTTLAKII